MTTTMDVRIREFSDDKRGAVMLTGLFMSVFLIGALWFIMGIGDAIVFRNKMQEATDHGVFAASALNAKGMNFISLCNLIMLVGTMIHIVLGLISDIAGAVYSVCLAACLASCLVGCEACECVEPTWKAWSGAYRVWNAYFTGMKYGFKALSMAEKAASYIYPAMGVVASYQVGSKYGGDSRTGSVTVVSLGPSQIPGAAIRGLGNLGGGGGKDPKGGLGAQAASNMTKEGLPVSQKEFKDLCKHVVSFTTGGVAELIGLGKSLGGGIGGKALRIFNSIIGSALEWRYCNPSMSAPFFSTDPQFWEPFPLSGAGGGMDSFWGEKGFMVVYPPASNGNVWFQTWGMNFMPKLTDNNESKVKMAGDKPTQSRKYSKTEQPFGYFAQSEFYFDCNENWEGLACNSEDHATFAIKWRARLRKLDLPALTSGIVGAGLDALTELPGVKEVMEKFPKQASEKLGEVIGTSGLGQAALEKALGSAVDQAKEWATGQITGAAGKLDPTLGGFGIGVYH